MTRPPPQRFVAAGVALAIGIAAACGGDDAAPMPTPDASRPDFDAPAAYTLLRQQVAFGPRIPGSAGHSAQLAWMLERLTTQADTVVADTFTHAHTETGEQLTLTNVLARFAPEAERRLLFLAHWDTRPISDAAASAAERAQPVPGANDGASGTAVLLQVAQQLSADGPVPVGVDLLFVDGEDYGPTTADMFLGARHYAATRAANDRPEYGVLLDMVGDLDPRFPVEGNSAAYAPEIVQKVWGVASALGYGRYFPLDVGPSIADDHVPLNQVGLPTVDIIDFEYGPDNAYWHTPDDVPDRTGAFALGMVGEIVLELIYSGG
jgi:Zn-dependent M28 family amino/carboxypeptidase